MSNAKVFTSLFDIRYSVFDIKILNLMTLAGIHFYPLGLFYHNCPLKAS